MLQYPIAQESHLSSASWELSLRQGGQASLVAWKAWAKVWTHGLMCLEGQEASYTVLLITGGGGSSLKVILWNKEKTVLNILKHYLNPQHSSVVWILTAPIFKMLGQRGEVISPKWDVWLISGRKAVWIQVGLITGPLLSKHNVQNIQNLFTPRLLHPASFTHQSVQQWTIPLEHCTQNPKLLVSRSPLSAHVQWLFLKRTQYLRSQNEKDSMKECSEPLITQRWHNLCFTTTISALPTAISKLRKNLVIASAGLGLWVTAYFSYYLVLLGDPWVFHLLWQGWQVLGHPW